MIPILRDKWFEIEDVPAQNVPPPPFQNLVFKEDSRCLVFVFYRPSIDEQAQQNANEDEGLPASVSDERPSLIDPVNYHQIQLTQTTLQNQTQRITS